MLWDELHSRDSKRQRTPTALSEDEMDPSEQVARGDKHKDNAIFDETVAAYAARRKAAEELLVAALADSHAKAFRAYTHKVQWTTIGEAAVLGTYSRPPFMSLSSNHKH